MNKAKFAEYEARMNAITDPEVLKRAMQQNEFELRKKANRPIWWGSTGIAASVALFLLTGVFSGFTIGALWVVGTIMGAGFIASTVLSLVARRKYAIFNRAMKNRSKLRAMMEEEGHTAEQRAYLEKKLNKDLAWLHKKRLISQRERDEYGRNYVRPAVARGGTARDANREEEQARATAYNQTMDGLGAEVRDIMTHETTVRGAEWASRESNIEEDRSVSGTITVSSQSRNTETGMPSCNAEGTPLFDKRVDFNISSDKDLALVLYGVSTALKAHAQDGTLPFPLKIQATGHDGLTIDTFGEDGLIILTPEGTILAEGGNQLDNMAAAIFSALPLTAEATAAAAAAAAAETSGPAAAAEAGAETGAPAEAVAEEAPAEMGR